MGIGERIKQYRIKSNMTQKDLADQLHVTNQAVSRWENDEAEPSFDTMRAMAALFGCTMNDFFDMKSKEPEPIREVKVVERVVPQQTKQVLALCEKCNRPIYDTDGIHRFEKRIYHGRTSEMRGYLYCTACNDARLAEEQKIAEQKRANEILILKKRRVRSFVWPTIIFGILLAIAISFFSSGDSGTGTFTLVTGILGFFFAACLFLRNNFVEDLWMNIAEWGFVRMPGVIMDFSLEGFLIGIAIKIILRIIGFLIGLIAAAFATAVGLVVSPFAYPFALAKNFKQVAGEVPFED